MQTIVGNSMNGIMRVQTTIGRYAPKGMYTFQVMQCQDSFGRSTVFGEDILFDTFGINPLDVWLNQTGPGDNEAPAVLSFSFSPSEASTYEASVLVAVAIAVVDSVSGVSSCSMTFAVPKGQSGNPLSISFNLAAADVRSNSTFLGNLTFPRFSRQGYW